MANPAETYYDGVRRHATDLGLDVVVGTAVVVDPDRADTNSATSYPLPGLTVVFVDAVVAPRVSTLAGPEPITTDEFVRSTAAMGAELAGIGHQRVLDGPLQRPDGDTTATTFRVIDPADPDDLRRLHDLVEASGPDDADEADIDLDLPDPVITGFVDDENGMIAAYASGRPWEVEERFDDIGVLTHPEFRGRRLGALAVHGYIEYQRRHAPDRLPLYRCNRDNVGSNRTAESLGFTLIQRIGAVRFPT